MLEEIVQEWIEYHMSRQQQIAPTLEERGLSGPALRTFFRIAGSWNLTTEQQTTLLGTTRSTYFNWKRRPDETILPRDALERISYILGIYKALQILLPDTKAADAWVTRPNSAPTFAGRSALERMLSGQVADLYVVRQYLDAQRGWG
jgi:hypothetical protein